MDFNGLVRKRRSTRKFRPGGVTFRTLKEIIEAGRYAPSAGNRQPWHFVVVSSDADKRAIREICEKTDSSLSERISEDVDPASPLDFFTTCPFLILVFGENEKPYWREGCWSAITLMSLKTAELGLGTFAYTPQRTSEINRLLNAPSSWRLTAILPVGEPEEFPSEKDRPRKELDEVLVRAEDLPRLDRQTRMLQKKGEKEAREFLKGLPVFSSLTNEGFGELCSLVRIKRFVKGDVIVEKGDAPEDFFIVVQGMVEVLSVDDQGNERIITFLGEGECFGEMSILSGEPITGCARPTSSSSRRASCRGSRAG
jgi:nitroreductase